MANSSDTDATSQQFFDERFKHFKSATEEVLGAGMDGKIEYASSHLADPTYGSAYTARLNPRDEFPKLSIPPRIAQNMVRDMNQLNANPRLDLASFTTTSMEPEADQLIAETQAINLVDESQYPKCKEMEVRCCHMLADLWNAPKPASDKLEDQKLGTSTIGSSEACMLGGLALKRRWQKMRKAQGKAVDRPNLVLGANAQVCWEKLLNYFEIEGRHVPVTPEMPVMTADNARKHIDENTIGIVVMAGSTYNGQFEDTEAIDKLAEELNQEHDWGLRLHVDGASGGMVAPFLYPDLKFDFRLKNVNSISTSGHKYGLVYPGVGWVVWRNRGCVDESLIFHVNYLGVDQPTLQLNFSKNANMVVAQYYMFLRMGFEGYRKVISNCMMVAAHLCQGMLATGHFKLIGGGLGLPVVAFALKDERRQSWDEYDLSDRMKMVHWQIPAYTLPEGATDQRMLRCVVREDLSFEMADDLVKDLDQAVEWLDHHFNHFSQEKMDELHLKFHVSHPVTHKKHPHRHPKNRKLTGVC